MSDAGWTFHSHYVQTVVVNDDDVYLVLRLDVGGFHGDATTTQTRQQQQQRRPIAELSFEFETHCSQPCEFVLLMVCLFHCLSLFLCLFLSLPLLLNLSLCLTTSGPN